MVHCSNYFAACIFTLLLAGCASDKAGEAPGQDASNEETSTLPGPLRLVSWNVHNLYDNVANTCGDCAFEEVLTTSEYTAKIKGISEGLAQLDGDVVFLQEVENEVVLNALADSPALASKGYIARNLLFGNDPRGINIGLLSRTPIDSYVSHKDDEFTRVDAPAYVYRFARDAVEVHMTYRGHHVAMVGVHFKARVNDDDPDRRVAEAQHARAIADAILASDPAAYVFLLGDFNDTPGTDAYSWARDGENGPPFLHALASVPMADRYTYEYGNEKQLLDHLLASPNAGERWVEGSSAILHDETLPSDHAPIAATYTVP